MTPQEFIQQASELTATQKRSLAQLLLEQANIDAQQKPTASEPTQTVIDEPASQSSPEHEWLQQNWEAYLDQYVCLAGSQLISAGENHYQVYAQARAAGIQAPLIVRVQNPNLAYIDGFVAA